MADTRDAPATGSDSVAELLRQLSHQTTTLVHQEVELAKAELAEKGRRAGAGAGLYGGAGVVAVLALGALTAAGVAGLANALPVWAAALVVGAALLGVAGVLGLRGKKEIQEGTPPVPSQAVESTKEDVEWLKTQARSAKP
ncbi:phage holin family protein [Acidiferrimicrobium sp. IK]|uniref:phage holin family protein n=1 Tax=Acidiferrimicrobium sp. IK TaxID=2871700 RepID=UPI0021CAE783|nr:phage holin family protein [Acidiferrimicrobium sp. IK]MCU4185334.1 phage holin family protein [Acidiferrimicrobium sp. IK]